MSRWGRICPTPSLRSALHLPQSVFTYSNIANIAKNTAAVHGYEEARQLLETFGDLAGLAESRFDLRAQAVIERLAEPMSYEQLRTAFLQSLRVKASAQIA